MLLIHVTQKNEYFAATENIAWPEHNKYSIYVHIYILFSFVQRWKILESRGMLSLSQNSASSFSRVHFPNTPLILPNFLVVKGATCSIHSLLKFGMPWRIFLYPLLFLLLHMIIQHLWPLELIGRRPQKPTCSGLIFLKYC